MKKIFSLFAVLFIFVSFASAQEIKFTNYAAGEASDAKSAIEKAGAELSQAGDNASEWNYGSIENASTGIRYFKFTNTGDAPLIISAAKGSCGCTIPSYPKEPIMPGESNFIKVKYDTKRTGAFTKYVTLTTNSVSNATSRLKIYGTVAAPATNSAPAVVAPTTGN